MQFSFFNSIRIRRGEFWSGIVALACFVLVTAAHAQNRQQFTGHVADPSGAWCQKRK